MLAGLEPDRLHSYLQTVPAIARSTNSDCAVRGFVAIFNVFAWFDFSCCLLCIIVLFLAIHHIAHATSIHLLVISLSGFPTLSLP